MPPAYARDRRGADLHRGSYADCDFHSPDPMAFLVHPALLSFRPVLDLKYAESKAILATERSVRDPRYLGPSEHFSIKECGMADWPLTLPCLVVASILNICRSRSI